MKELPAVTICGAGSAGTAMAADIAMSGSKVNLFELPKFRSNLAEIKAQGGIDLTGETTSGRTGFAKLNKITTTAEEAVKGADVVMVTAPAFGHEAFTKAIAPYLKSGQILLFNTGYWGTLRVAPILRKTHLLGKVILAEDNIMPYLSRRHGGRAHIHRIKQCLRIAGWPARDTKRALEVVRTIYPQHVAAKSILETNFWSSNVSTHAPINLGNATFFFDRAREFRQAGEITPCASRLIDAFDKERIAVAAALDTEVTTELTELEVIYGYKGATHYEAMVTSEHAKRWTTDAGNRRVLKEDLCYFHIPMEQIAKIVGIPVPVTTAIVELLTVFAGQDYRAEGLSLDKLGMGGFTTREQIIRYALEGVK